MPKMQNIANKPYMALAFILLLGISMVACKHGRPPEPKTPTLTNTSLDNSPASNPSTLTDKKAPKEDLRPKLRVLTWSGYDSYLPRSGSPTSLELDYLHQFADEQELNLVEIHIARFEDLIPKLIAGEGDVIAANLTITENRKTQVAFSVPFEETQEFLVQGAHSKPLTKAQDLNHLSIGITSGTAFEQTAIGLKKAYPGVNIKLIPSSVSTEAIYDQMLAGEFDLTIEDKNTLNTTLQYRDDIQMSLAASGKRKIAWAVKFDNKALLKQLNSFLRQEKLTIHSAKDYKNRWDRIQQEKTIRFVMPNSFSSYYFWRGELLGFNYELAKKFAKDHRLRLEIIVAQDHSDMLTFLLEDKADIALAYLTPTAERIAQGIAFSKPYHYAQEVVVAHKDLQINSIEELNQKTALSRRSSSYWSTLSAIKKEQLPALTLQAADESDDTPRVIDRIANKEADFTLADSHIANLELVFRDDIHIPMAIGEKQEQSWAVAAGEEALLDNINRFIGKHYKGLFYNVKYNQYFKNKSRVSKHFKHYSDVHKNGTLSPYDALIKKYAKEYDFDWRLMVAQMHQESGFSQQAKSFAGATGLFQVMPRTARQLGIKDLSKPENNIRAGISYMHWVRERMRHLDPEEGQLIWFTLAAYNAGIGHVKDAAYLAEKKGWDKQMWFGNVEKAMLLLSQQQYAKKARHGYVRGSEPVNYVRSIKRRFDTFKLAVDR